MLTNFEELTADLTEYESNVVLPRIADGISKKVGKNNAVTSTTIIHALRIQQCFDPQYIITDVRIRKIISIIRNSNVVGCVCSSSAGYYVAESVDEIDRTIESLRQRVRQQQRAIDALVIQRSVIFGTSSPAGALCNCYGDDGHDESCEHFK